MEKGFKVTQFFLITSLPLMSLRIIKYVKLVRGLIEPKKLNKSGCGIKIGRDKKVKHETHQVFIRTYYPSLRTDGPMDRWTKAMGLSKNGFVEICA